MVRHGASPQLMIDFDRTKYGRELLIDAAMIRQMPTFITDATPHTLQFHDILLVTRGRGTLRLDGEPYRVRPGAVFFCLPGQIRQWRLTSMLDGACLFFAEHFLSETFRDARFLDHFAFFRLPRASGELMLNQRERKLFRNRFTAMQREILNLKSDAAHPLRATLYEILVSLNRAYVAKYGEPPRVATDSIVARFRSLVEGNYAKRHRVADYASELHITPGHLNFLCRSQLRFSAGAFIRARIVLEARRLLVYSDLSAVNIAELLGFEDAAYFTRFFARETGSVPTRFRAARYT